MEKKSRFELIKIVEAQKEQQSRYETRFRGELYVYLTVLKLGGSLKEFSSCEWNEFKGANMQLIEGVVSKETVVLRRWGSSIQKFGFINGVDNVNWPPYRDSKS